MDNDDPYNKSLVAAQMTSVATNACDYTVLPQDTIMTSSLTGRRMRVADGNIRSPNRAVYVSSLDWRSEVSPTDGGTSKHEIETDDMDRVTWSCDCRLLPVSLPPPPASSVPLSAVSVSGLTHNSEADGVHWPHLAVIGDPDEHRRCTCTSGRCRQTSRGLPMPAEITPYRDPCRHVLDNANSDEDGSEDVRPRTVTIAAPPSECIQY
jgi:hypothetical protein